MYLRKGSGKPPKSIKAKACEIERRVRRKGGEDVKEAESEFFQKLGSWVQLFFLFFFSF